MEKNHIIGFILIFSTLLVWSILTAPSEAELAEHKRMADSIALAENAVTTDTLVPRAPAATTSQPAVSDSQAMLANQYAYGPFAAAAAGTSEKVVLKNNEIQLTFDSKGGRIIDAWLPNYKKVKEGKDKQRSAVVSELHLLEDEKNRFEYFIPIAGVPAGGVNTADLYFVPTLSTDKKVSFRAATSTGGYIEQTYELAAEGYTLDYNVKLIGLDRTIPTDAKDISLDWKVYLDKIEKSEEFEQRYSTLYYKEVDARNADYCKCISDDRDELDDEAIQWVSHTNQFFTSALISKEKPFSSGVMETKMTDVETDVDLKLTQSTLTLPYGHTASEEYAMQLYVGPKDYKRLAAFDVELDQIIPFGNSIFGSINRHVIRPFFNFLSKYVSSKGIVILLMIFLVKMLLYPLMFKMLKSQALMGALKPELAHLTDKYKDDAQKKQVETMKIYKEYGVSPFGGCMPMVIQIPIWYALFRFFPASITFRQEAFLWASDLSSYDDFFHLPFEIPFVGDHLSLFTILYSVSMLVYTYYNTKHMDMSANPAMKYVQYLMPVMFFGFFNTYASGLTCYMFFSNLINIAQTVITKKFVFDDEKLKAELRKKKAAPKKTNKFQQRLEAAMKEQQAKEQSKKRK